MALNLDSLHFWKLRLVDGYKGNTIDLQHGRMHYIAKPGLSSRPTMVFVHGTAASAYHYDPVLQAVSRAGYPIIAPDLLSHGLSGDASEKLTVEEFYQVFAEFLDRVVVGPMLLVGNSLGGGVAYRYSLENPDKVIGLVAMSPVGGFVDREDLENFKKSVVGFDSPKKVAEFLGRLFHQRPWYLPLFTPFFEKSLRRQGLLNMIHSIQFEYFEQLRTLSPLQVPALFIWGKSERVFPRAHLEWFKQNLPKHVVFEEPEEIGHCPQIEAPQWLSERILRFARERQGG